VFESSSNLGLQSTPSHRDRSSAGPNQKCRADNTQAYATCPVRSVDRPDAAATVLGKLRGGRKMISQAARRAVEQWPALRPAPEQKLTGTHSPARDLEIADAIRSTSRVSPDDPLGGGKCFAGQARFQFIESLNSDLQCKLKFGHLRPTIIVIHAQRATSSEERNSTRCRLSAICTCSRSRQSSLYCSSSLTTEMGPLPPKRLRADLRRAAECLCSSELDWLGFIELRYRVDMTPQLKARVKLDARSAG
jgi:hypothetical protein